MTRNALLAKSLRALAAALILCLAAACAGCAKAPSPAVTVLFINVGKAGAALVRAADQAFLIDAGAASSAPQVIAAMRVLGVEHLEGVFLSPAHADHLGGQDAVAQAAEIGALYAADVPYSEADEDKTGRAARRLGLPLLPLRAGDIVIVSEEETLLKSGAKLRADVMKVGNHGNPDATGAAFVRAVSPRIAVISTDRSADPDSANAAVLQRLSSSQVFLTEGLDLGLLVSAAEDGLHTGAAVRPAPALSVRILRADKAGQTVTLVNDGETADLSGCLLFSAKGGELFIFPEGSLLAHGEETAVACEGKAGDYLWPDKNVWNKKGGDTAVLYGRFGNVLSSADSL